MWLVRNHFSCHTLWSYQILRHGQIDHRREQGNPVDAQVLDGNGLLAFKGGGGERALCKVKHTVLVRRIWVRGGARYRYTEDL